LFGRGFRSRRIDLRRRLARASAARAARARPTAARLLLGNRLLFASLFGSGGHGRAGPGLVVFPFLVVGGWLDFDDFDDLTLDRFAAGQVFVLVVRDLARRFAERLGMI